MKRWRIVLPVLAGFAMGLVVAGQLQSAEAQRSTAAPEECSVTVARKTRQLRAARKELDAQRATLQDLLDREHKHAEELQRLLDRERVRVQEIEKRIGPLTQPTGEM